MVAVGLQMKAWRGAEGVASELAVENGRDTRGMLVLDLLENCHAELGWSDGVIASVRKIQYWQ